VTGKAQSEPATAGAPAARAVTITFDGQPIRTVADRTVLEAAVEA